VLRRPHGPQAGDRDTRALDIGPRQHTELHTVTWLVAGEVLHRDSLGTEQIIRAGQLNLMTAGQGVTHSEEATGRDLGQGRDQVVLSAADPARLLLLGRGALR